MHHLGYNLEFYLHDLLERNEDDINFWVIRQEHMEHDLNAIERALGGKHEYNFEVGHDHFSKRPMNNRTVSDKGLKNLCRALCPEIQIHKQVLRRAKNKIFDSEFYYYSTIALVNQCPLQAMEEECEVTEMKKNFTYYVNKAERRTWEVMAKRSLIQTDSADWRKKE